MAQTASIGIIHFLVRRPTIYVVLTCPGSLRQVQGVLEFACCENDPGKTHEFRRTFHEKRRTAQVKRWAD